jgi:hypothetical protein
MADFDKYINQLQNRAQFGLGAKRMSQLHGDIRRRTASTFEGQKAGAEQRFQRFGSPVVDSYLEKLERGRQQAVAEGTSQVESLSEQVKSDALAQLPQAFQIEEQRKNRWFDAISSLIGSGASVLGGGAFDLMEMFNDSPEMTQYTSPNIGLQLP